MRQFETGIVINDKSQCAVARHLRYCGIVSENLVQIHCRVCLWKNYFKISEHLVKLQTRTLIISRALCAWALSCWKMKNSPEIFKYDKKQLLLTVVTSIFTWLRQSDWCRPILTCQLTPLENVTERWWCVKGFCCEAFVLCCCSCVQSVILWVVW